MPFKTKRQKIAASARRYHESASVSITYSGDIEPHENRKSPAEVVINKDDEVVEKLDYVGRDIIKILLLASIISGAQIVLALLRAPLKVW